MALEYLRLTGKPLGITGEVAEVSAAKILGLELMPPRQEGYDAIRRENGEKIQIKGLHNPKKSRRTSKIATDKEWDVMVLVVLDENLEVKSIYEAEKAKVKGKLDEPGSEARNKKRTLSVGQFISIAKLVWPKP